MKTMKKLLPFLLALIMVSALTVTAFAERADFEYKLTLTDQNGKTITNPRALSAGDTLNIEIELTRTDTSANAYDTYGLEFRLMTRGLSYNNDGAAFRSETPVRLISYDSGDSVGFAYYDMEQQGERINNPMLVCKWSYTVLDPGAVNITVPVGVLYIRDDEQSYEPVGNAVLYLIRNGGTIIGGDISGEYRSGTVVTLPDMELANYVFLGWSDGANVYPAGSQYTVTGYVSLTPQWANVERDRQLLLDAKDGAIDGLDPSGMYANGERAILPNAEREGFRFLGWSDGEKLYQPGEEYPIENSVILTAQWEELADVGEDEIPRVQYRNEESVGLSPWLWAAPTGLLGLLLLLLLLFKRNEVLYSLVNGDVALNYKDSKHDYQVEVVLYDGRKEYRLNKSGRVEVKHRLNFIKGTEELPIADIEKGTYKGKLIVTSGHTRKEVKCRVRVLDREIKERENR